MRSMVQLKIGYFRCFPLFVVSQLVVEKTGKNNGLHVSKDWQFACAEWLNGLMANNLMIELKFFLCSNKFSSTSTIGPYFCLGIYVV